MPTWLSVLLGLLTGMALIAGALVWAFRPEFKARRKRSALAPPSGRDPDDVPIPGLTPGPD